MAGMHVGRVPAVFYPGEGNLVDRAFIIPASGTLVPLDRPYWTNETMVNQRFMTPTFTTIEVAQVFFGRSRTWFKHLMHLEADEVGPIDVPRADTHNQPRRWRLYDIERFAHVLLIHHVIGLNHFSLVLHTIRCVATMYGYDVGDRRFDSMWRVGEDPVRALAMELIDAQLHADEETPTVGETERLADLAAWAIRKLEDHLKEKA